MTVAMTKDALADRMHQRRAEIGRLKREKTKMRLIAAAARVVAERGDEGVTIEHFIEAAGVSRGTFYNYFQTRDELIAEVWGHLGKTPLSYIRSLHDGDPDPAYRLTSGMRMGVRIAQHDHAWGWLVFRVSGGGDTRINEELRSFPLGDIRAGIASKRFTFGDADTACDFFLGVAMMAIKAVMIGERSSDYGEQCAALVLRGLGLEASDADAVARRPLPDIG